MEGDDSSRLVGFPIMTAGDLRRQREKRKKEIRRRGYCECCAVKYEDIDKVKKIIFDLGSIKSLSLCLSLSLPPSCRCSLKYLGVKEPTRDNYRANADVIVDVLNECSSSRTWHHSDIERVHRIGARRQRSDQPQPLIVEFHRWSDRMEILTDRALRDLLRREGHTVKSFCASLSLSDALEARGLVVQTDETRFCACSHFQCMF